MSRRLKLVILVSWTAAAVGCTIGTALPGWCDSPVRAGTLPSELRESSGVAIGRDRPDILWTHNDSGHEPVLFGLDSVGQVRQRVRVAGAENGDWEDVAMGPCDDAGERACLYIGDIGNNTGARTNPIIYRVPEPTPGDDVTATAERLPIGYPDGAFDAEALFVLPSGAIYVITDGRNEPATVYRYPAPARPGERVVLERVQTLGSEARGLLGRVTGAAADPDGRWVVVRTYTSAQLHRVLDGRLEAAVDSQRLSLGAATEPQGEAIDIREDGAIVLTSEGGPDSAVPAGPVTWIRCRLP